MAAVQTKLQFNIRKKRLHSARTVDGKENTDLANKKLLTKTGIQHEKGHYVKYSENEDSLLRPSSLVVDTDSDSDIECISRTKPGTVLQVKTKNFRSTKKLRIVDTDDESTGSAYQQVRQAFQGCIPARMPGREEHLNKMHSFLQYHLTTGSSGTLYVSGPPGTGKTACLSKLTNSSEFKNGYKIININCTSMKSSGSIYARLAQELAIKVSKYNEKNYLTSIERYLASKRKMILMVLDEIDQLESRNQSVLYTIFEWPSKFNSKLVLIGIANALDLTDRILPRLQTRLDLKPHLLHFTPYTKSEIVNILTDRLEQSGVSGMFLPATLELLAGKVASTCGDVRRALDIGRRVIELAAAQRSNQPMPLQPTMDHETNTLSPRKSPRKNRDTVFVAIKDVMTVLNSVYGTSQLLDAECDDCFPLQQKVLVSTLLLMLKNGHNKDITIGKLHDIYCRVCKKKNLLAVDQAEFLSLCQLVETRGILKVQKRKEARQSRVCLQWDEEEVCSVLQDKQLLASILNDLSCLT